MSKKDIKDYIVKLNDRNIQRQRESGFTLYAVLALILYCLIYLLNNICVVDSIFENESSLVVINLSSNIVFVLLQFFFAYAIATRRQPYTRIFINRSSTSYDFSDLPFILFLILILVINLVSFSSSKNTTQFAMLLIFSFLAISNILSPLIMRWLKRFSLRSLTKKISLIEKIDFDYFNRDVTRRLSISLIIGNSLLMSLIVFNVMLLDLNVSLDTVAKIFQYVATVYLTIILVQIALVLKNRERDNNELQEFEREIFFDNLSDEEIIRKYEEEHVGIPFSKWLKNKHIEIESFFSSLHEQIAKLTSKVQSIEEIDRTTFPYEFSGRIQAVVVEGKTLVDKANDFVVEISTSFTSLKSFSSLNNEEVDKLDFVTNQINKQIKNFNSQYLEIMARVDVLSVGK